MIRCSLCFKEGKTYIQWVRDDKHSPPEFGYVCSNCLFSGINSLFSGINKLKLNEIKD